MSPLYRTVGPYQIVRELGSGGMADVFVAEDSRDGSTVALKIPRRDPEVRSAERVGALLQSRLAELDGRVARVYEIGEDEGVPYIAMEYVEGEDLSERIARGPLPPEDALRIATELCDLLAAAHGFAVEIDGRAHHGIVHGDLKPRNVRLARGGRVRVVDFGIAKALSETRKRTHNEFGSLPYSSPERIDTGHVDAHSDVWAAAVVLYEMLTTHPPFRADHPRGLEQLIMSGAAPSPLPAGCPPALPAVLAKALAPRGADRYASAAELRDELEAVLEGAPTVAARELAGVGSGTGANGWAAEPGALDVAERADAEVTRRGPGSGAHPGNGVPPPDADSTRRTPVANGDDATRRMMSAADDATRRSPSAVPAAASVAGGAQPPDSPPGAAVKAPAARHFPAIVRLTQRLGVIVGVVLIANEVFAFSAASELDGRLAGFARSDAPEVWAQYRRLDRRSILKIGTLRASGPVKNWHVRVADDLIGDYLSNTPTIRETGWKQAAALLQRAATISPGDSRVAARRRHCAGQLARIEAEARLERKPEQATAAFNDARRAFEEATRQWRGWPDPWLGLARVYAIGYQDVDQAREALDEASRAGYRLGDRETALMADAHRLRAERAWKAVPGLPDEVRYLEQIRSDCWRALELYSEVPAYGQVNRDIRKTHSLLDRVNRREDALNRASRSDLFDDVARGVGSLFGIR